MRLATTPTRRLALTLVAAIAVLLGLTAAPAGAETTFGGLGRIGEVSIRTGEAKGDIELEENDTFAVEPGTGDFYVVDFVEEPQERTRIQKFSSTGTFIAQALVKLGGGEHELEPRATALDAEKHKLYVLLDGERSSNSKHDASDLAAAEILTVSTEAKGEELAVSTLIETKGLEPYSEKAKTSLIEPAGLAIDPQNHDLLVSAQQDEDVSEGEELRAVIQRVHENGKLGPRYVDNQNCLDGATKVASEPKCEELGGEQPNSLAVTSGGHALVEMELAQLWEIPISANASEGFKEEKIVPVEKFALPEPSVVQLSGEEEQTNSLAYVSTGTEEGRIYAGAEVSIGKEPFNYALMLLKATEHAGQLTVTEQGWTGGGSPTSSQKKCRIPFSAEIPLEVTAAGEQALVLSGIEREEGGRRVVEPFLAKFGTGSGAEACGHVEVTVPAIAIESNANVQEVPVGKSGTLSSKVEGADALSTSWKVIRRENGKVESEQTLASPTYLGQETALPYKFEHTGEYEFIETVTTDEAGTPTKQVVRKVTASLPAITFKVEPNSTLPAGGLPAGTALGLHAKVSDPNEKGAGEPHLTLTWTFSDGSAPVKQEVVGNSGSYSAEITHAFASTCSGICTATLEVQDKQGAKGRSELHIAMYTPPPPVQQEPQPTPTPTPETRPPTTEVEHAVVVQNPEAKIAGASSLSVKSSGATTIGVSCPAGQSECTGTVTITTVIARSAGKGKKPKKVTVTLAKESFTVTGGATKTLSLHLSSQGRSLLAKDHTLHATATFLAHDSSGTIRKTIANVTLKLAKKH